MNMAVNYMGLKLAHPVMIGASPLTLDVQSIKACAKAGASAVIMKSLFEEQLHRDTAGLSSTLLAQEVMHTEVYEYLEAHIGMRYGARDYLEIIRQAKQSVEIPIIASINCISAAYWQELAGEIEAAGADGLELHIGIIPTRPETTGQQVEERVLSIVKAARAAVKLPLAVKLGHHYSSLPQLVTQVAAAGADACVLFNRLWVPTIEITEESLIFNAIDSSSAEFLEVLHGVAQAAEISPAQICANTGIKGAADVIRALLAGATAVQVVNAPLRQGLATIASMSQGLASWMQEKEYEQVDDFRGKLSQSRNQPEDFFNRLQYMQAMGTELK